MTFEVWSVVGSLPLVSCWDVMTAGFGRSLAEAARRYAALPSGKGHVLGGVGWPVSVFKLRAVTFRFLLHAFVVAVRCICCGSEIDGEFEGLKLPSSPRGMRAFGGLGGHKTKACKETTEGVQETCCVPLVHLETKEPKHAERRRWETEPSLAGLWMK